MIRAKGADSFSAEQKHTSKIREKRTAFSVEKIEKAVFKVEILTDFIFYVCFLAALNESAPAFVFVLCFLNRCHYYLRLIASERFYSCRSQQILSILRFQSRNEISFLPLH